MRYGISILGILVVLFLAWLASSNRKEVKFKPIITMIVIQIILSVLLLNTEYGLIIIKGISTIFSILLEYANEGSFLCVWRHGERGRGSILFKCIAANCIYFCINWNSSTSENSAVPHEGNWIAIK